MACFDLTRGDAKRAFEVAVTLYYYPCGGGLLLPVPAAARPAGFDRAIDCRGGLIVDEPARSLPEPRIETIPRLKMTFSRGKSAFATAK